VVERKRNRRIKSENALCEVTEGRNMILTITHTLCVVCVLCVCCVCVVCVCVCADACYINVCVGKRFL